MGKRNTTQKKRKNKKEKQRSNTSKCTSKIDIFTQEKFTKKSNIIKFQPNQSQDVFSCYEKKSLSKYITFELNKGVNIDEIADATTRVPFGLEFLCAHFANEIFKYIEVELIEILSSIVENENYPDGRAFENEMDTYMEVLDYYHLVWLHVDKRRYTMIKKKVHNMITSILKDVDTDFEERAMDEVDQYFDQIHKERDNNIKN